MSDTSNENKPDCFSHLERVFPMGEEGIRSTPIPCESCPYKMECLKATIDGPDGLKLKEEYVDRAYESGMIGFMERWAKKKAIQSKLKHQNDADG